MKRFFLATIGLLGLGNSLTVYSATYTHNLIYTATDTENSATLEGTITFEDTHSLATNNTDLNFANGTNFSGFITSITFTYRPTGAGGVVQTLDINDISMVHIKHKGDTDFAAANLKGELNDLYFFDDGAGAFTLNRTNDFRINAASEDDFTLSSTTYHSPGPLPLFGLFTALSSMKTLKSKYKKKYNL